MRNSPTAPVVRSIPERKIIARLKAAGDQETLDYINALKEVIEGWEDINRLAMKKIRELSNVD